MDMDSHAYSMEKAFNSVILSAMSKIDTTLNGDIIEVKETWREDAPARTDLKDIFINLEMARGCTKDDALYLALIKALNLHEYGHIKYTPECNADILALYPKLYRDIDDYNEYKRLLNVLEDARLENNLIKDFSKCREYFKLAFSLFIYPNLADELKVHDEKISRASILNIFARLDGTDYIKDDAVFNGLYESYKELFLKVFDAKETEIFNNNLKAYLKETDKIKRLKHAFSIYEIVREKKDAEYKDDADENKGGGENKDGDNKEDGDGEEKDGEKKPHEKKLRVCSCCNRIVYAYVCEMCDKHGKKSDAGFMDNTKEIRDEIKDIIEKISARIEKDGDLKSELENYKRDIERQTYIETKEIKDGIAQFKRDIQRLKNELAKKKVYGTRAGNFSIKDYIRNGHDARKCNNVFMKKQHISIDKLKIAVSLLIDASGSVSDENFKIQLDTTYLICKSLEQIGGKTEVIEFSGREVIANPYKILKTFDMPVKNGEWRRHFSRGNEICKPLKIAMQDLKNVRDANNKIVVLITDGGLKYDGDTKEDMRDTINLLIKNNIPVHCILINPDDTHEIYKDFSSLVTLKEFKDVCKSLNNLIVNIQKDFIKTNLKRGGF